MPDVLVVGAGVIGLTAAVRLREAGAEVDVVAVAAAIWYPYLAFPRDRVAAWSARGFEVLSELAAEPATTGVRMRWGTERLPDGGGADPWWRDAVPTFEHTAEGYRFETPVADMSVHLPWLARRLEALGVPVAVEALGGVHDALARAPVAVNCTGLGARTFAGDGSMVAVRGQVVYVEQMGLEEWFMEEDRGEELLYVVPRERDVVLGGVAQEGAEDRAADPATATAIRARCVAAVPALAGARVLGGAVGLRPARPEVRLEAEARDGGTVVHCYGHGGAGVTLAWGCAEEVVRLVRDASPG